MADVIDIAAHQPHLSGTVICAACGHEWEAVAPIGTVSLECPECGSYKGFFRGQVERPGPHWHCACGNPTFMIDADDRVYCLVCGVVAGALERE